MSVQYYAVTVGRLNLAQIDAWRTELATLAKETLANPTLAPDDTSRRRMHVLAFMLKRYDALPETQPDVDLGAAVENGATTRRIARRLPAVDPVAPLPSLRPATKVAFGTPSDVDDVVRKALVDRLGSTLGAFVFEETRGKLCRPRRRPRLLGRGGEAMLRRLLQWNQTIQYRWRNGLFR